MTITLRTSGMFQTNSYLVEDGDDVFLIDAPDGNRETADLVRKRGRLTAVLLTHGHFDHVMGLRSILSVFPGTPVWLGKEDLAVLRENRKYLRAFGIPESMYTLPENLHTVDYKDEIGPFRVIRTPGHTPGSVALWNSGEKILFSGDTLFKGGEGRTDLGGDWSLLQKSLKALMSLPEDTRVFPGHGEETTIAAEKALTFRF